MTCSVQTTICSSCSFLKLRRCISEQFWIAVTYPSNYIWMLWRSSSDMADIVQDDNWFIARLINLTWIGNYKHLKKLNCWKFSFSHITTLQNWFILKELIVLAGEYVKFLSFHLSSFWWKWQCRSSSWNLCFGFILTGLWAYKVEPLA
jgi:hypothetical protein